MTDCMDIMRVKDNGWILQDPCISGSLSQVYDTGILLQVTVLMVWNGELEIRFYYWPCDHLASYGVVHYHKHTNIWSCSLRSKKFRHIIVNYLYWLYEMVSLRLNFITDPALIWPHMALWWSLQQLLEIVTMVWKCNLSQLITAFSLICWCGLHIPLLPKAAVCTNKSALEGICKSAYSLAISCKFKFSVSAWKKNLFLVSFLCHPKLLQKWITLVCN